MASSSRHVDNKHYTKDDLPIDIHLPKLTEWLADRKITSKDWLRHAGKAQELLNNMLLNVSTAAAAAAAEKEKEEEEEEEEEATTAATVIYEHYTAAIEELQCIINKSMITYWDMKRITELLPIIEKSSKNVFGRYTSPLIQSWINVMCVYEKDNLYLATSAQQLVASVVYDIPSMKANVKRMQCTLTVSDRKEASLRASIADYSEKFSSACRDVGLNADVARVNAVELRQQLQELAVTSLPDHFQAITECIMKDDNIIVQSCMMYRAFSAFMCRISRPKDTAEGTKKCKKKKGHVNVDIDVDSTVIAAENALPLLFYFAENGNVSVRQWKTGEPDDVSNVVIDRKARNEDNINVTEEVCEMDSIDWGDLNAPTATENEGAIDWGGSGGDDGIDWGGADTSNDNVDDTANWQASFVVEEEGHSPDSILADSTTRTQITDELLELEAFLTQRAEEMTSAADVLSLNQFQDAPSIVQAATSKSVSYMLASVKEVLSFLTSPSLQRLLLIESSPAFAERLATSLHQKLGMSSKIRENIARLNLQRKATQQQLTEVAPRIQETLKRIKTLQCDVEAALSNIYNGRLVNIIGDINAL